MSYPSVMSERDTLAAARAGRSLARFGDGELRIATGQDAISQRYDQKLAYELREILRGQQRLVLPCIPRIDTPDCCRPDFWRPYGGRYYTGLYYSPVAYGSSFITRPDNIPAIDTLEYWAEVRKFWAGKNVAYVSGDETLHRVVNADAATCDFIRAPKRNAYQVIDELTTRLLDRPYDAVVIALGAAGTALAARLGTGGAQHALDLGHIGQFMEHPGAFSHKPDDLTSPEYRQLLRDQHARTNWGKGGHSWADKVLAFAKDIGAEQALDYGCGQATLAKMLAGHNFKCANYDPGRLEYSMPPKLADLVVSTDVFEHVEPEKVDAVLLHTFQLARKGAFFAIAKQPAKAILADNRNAHLLCKPDEWWLERLRAAGWTNLKVAETAWKKCVILCRK